MSTRAIITLVAALVVFVLGGVVGCYGHSRFNPAKAVPLIGKSDTITLIDTLEVFIPVPIKTEPAGMATVTPRTNSDTSKIAASTPGGVNVPRETLKDDTPTLQPSGNIDIPLERKTYSTAEFKAVVSGWRPNLDSMTVYPRTITVTNEKIVTKAPRFAITAGVSYGYDGERWRAVAGVTAGYVIFSR